MEKTYYLYRHIRLDINQVFYVGIGTRYEKGKYLCKIYHRGYLKSPSRRSEFWRNVFKNCNSKIEIDILFETNSIDLIKQKEIEFIKLYGRKDLGLGTLTNLTDGGDGVEGHTWTEEQKITRSNKMKGEGNHFYKKKHSPETIEFLRLKGVEEYENSKIKDYKHHSRKTRDILSKLGKERAKKGTLPKLPILKGSDNFFSRKFLVISPDNRYYLVEGGIKDFCQEFNLSYGYCKKFKDKGKCFLEDVGRARYLAKNTVNWEFKTYTEDIKIENLIIYVK